MQDLPANVRKDMAVKSRVELPNGGSEERHLIIQELHQKMLDAEAQVRPAKKIVVTWGA